MSNDSRFNVPEPQSELSLNFLQEYWTSTKPLPKVTGVSALLYQFSRGLQTLTALPGSNSIAVMTIAISVFLFGGFLITLQNVDMIISDAGESTFVTAYIKEGSSEKELETLRHTLKEDSSVRSIEYVSKQDALLSFRKALGTRSGFLEGLEEDNPLPASLDLLLHPDELGIGSVDRMLAKLRSLPIISEVVYGSEWVSRVQGVLQIFRIFAITAVGIVLCIIVFLVANTIRLVLFSRKDEISIMQLVGATDEFIRTPFLIGGAIKGFLGAFLAVLVLRGAFSLIDYELRSSSIFGVALPKLQFLGPFLIIFILVFGLLIGSIGSYLALRKSLKV